MRTTPTEDTEITRLSRWRAGETPGPWTAVVFPTNRCNLKCRMCWRHWVEDQYGKLDHSREVSDERLLRLVDEAADLGVRQWSIAGGGEPMIRADLIMAMCRRIRERGMNGGIFSNGTMFNEDHLRTLVEIGWERIDFSLDGPTAAINDPIRGEGTFERATTQMRRLTESRRAARTEHPIIDVHQILTRNNVEHLPEMARLVAGFKPSRTGVSTLVDQSEYTKTLALTPAQQAALPDYLRAFDETAQALGISTNAWTMFEAERCREQRDSGVARSDDPFLHAPCYEPWLAINVVAEGFVGPCCAFWDDQAPSLHEQSLEEVWTGPYFARLRENMLAHRMPHYCQWCPSHFVWRTEWLRDGWAAYEGVNVRTPAPIRGPGDLARRITSNLRRHGLQGTVRRAGEWARLRLTR